MIKILAIDDTQDNLISVAAILKQFIPDCEIFTALTGLEGIEIAKREHPDTILLDIIMPNMDGYQICAKLKQDIATSHIPIIMLTAIKTDSQSRIKGLQIGADAFASKPIDPQELIAQINVMLRIKEAEDKLRAEKVEVEELVKERTKELTVTNEKLRIEITERKRAENELKEKEAFNYALFKNNPIVTIVVDSNGYIIESNLSQKKYGSNPKKGDLMYKDYANKYDIDMHNELMECIRKEELKEFKEIKYKEKYLNIKIAPFDQGAIITSINITEQKLAENALRESELRLKTLINSSPNIIVFKDGKGRWLVANNSTIEVFVLENIDFYGKTDAELADVTNPIYKESFRACSITDEETWQKGTQSQIEEIIPTTDGMKRIYDITKVPLFEEDGERKGLLLTGHDVTERRNAEVALKSSEELYKNVFNNSPLGIAHFDANGVITDCNGEFIRIIGSSHEQLVGLNMIEQLKDQKIIDAVTITLETGSGYYNDYYTSITCKKTTPIVIHFRAIYSYENDIIGGVSIVEDITERKENEIEIQKLLNAVEQSQSSIVITDKDGNIEYTNYSFTRVTGYSKEEAIGQNPRILKTDFLAAHVYKKMWNTISSGTTWTGEFCNKKKNGELYWESAVISPIKNMDGDIINYVAIKEDITEWKKTEKQLEEKMDKLERFNRVMVDRELKMIELKKEINEFLVENGKSKKYIVKE